MLKKWRPGAHNKRNFDALLIDLSKAFGRLSHGLLVDKLNADGFSLLALRLVQSYLSNRKPRTNINSVVVGRNFVWVNCLKGQS